MDQTDRPGRIDRTYRLLALCARAEGHPVFYEQLIRQVEGYSAWQELPSKAEFYGLAPLVWHHMHQSGVSVPRETERTLRDLYLRHRVLNQVHTKVLTNINILFESAGLQALLLKGLALAYRYYPDPALRPVGDIDLLLEQADFLPALDLLIKAGFRAISSNQPSERIPKKLVAESPPQNGLRVHLELHCHEPKGKSILDNPLENEFEDFHEPPQTLRVHDCNVQVPAPIDTLRYLSGHLRLHLLGSHAERPLQLKWSADFISIIEREAESIDWDYLKRYSPDILKRLDVFYSLTPMPEQLARVIPVRQISPPEGLDQYLKGWPVQSFSQRRQVGFWRLLWRTFTPPSAWWLCLYYGIGKWYVFWYGQIVYRLQILRMMLLRSVRSSEK